jgi:ABC-type sugar transport system ATPase subunit
VAELRLEGVSKTYPSGLVAVRNVSLTVADGELVGMPDEIYARPDAMFVAGCLGNPTINTFTARLVSGPGSCQVVYGDQRLQLDQQEMRRHRIRPGPEQDAIVGIRPEALQAAEPALHSSAPAGQGSDRAG